MSETFERAVAALRLASIAGRIPAATEADLQALEALAPGIGLMYRAHVRAVLEAIREPDAAMLDAVFRIVGETDDEREPPCRQWQAMIDEMLRDV